ncbi:MAG: hypothetical protein ACP5P6_09910, partial [Candidatus Saccharicenans sp.]
MIKRILLVVFLISCFFGVASAQHPKVYWNFEKIEKIKTEEKLKANFNPEMSPPVAYVITGKTQEVINGKWDSLEGSFSLANGIKGQGLRLDGFTTALRSEGTAPIKIENALSVEAWIALGEYPLNWCPILTTEAD